MKESERNIRREPFKGFRKTEKLLHKSLLVSITFLSFTAVSDLLEGRYLEMAADISAAGSITIFEYCRRKKLQEKELL